MYVATCVANDVGEVADMTVLAGEAAMCFIEWIIVCTGAGAAVGEVAVLVNVDTVLGEGGEPSNRRQHVCKRIFTRLLKRYKSSNGGVARVEDTHRVYSVAANTHPNHSQYDKKYFHRFN